MKHAAPLGYIWNYYSLTDASKTFSAIPVFDTFAPIECFIDYLSGDEGDE